MWKVYKCVKNSKPSIDHPKENVRSLAMSYLRSYGVKFRSSQARNKLCRVAGGHGHPYLSLSSLFLSSLETRLEFIALEP